MRRPCRGRRLSSGGDAGPRPRVRSPVSPGFPTHSPVDTLAAVRHLFPAERRVGPVICFPYAEGFVTEGTVCLALHDDPLLSAKGKMMNAKFQTSCLRYSLWLVAIALLFSGCNLVKHRMGATRKPAPSAAQASEIESLRQENDALRKDQQEAKKKLDSLTLRLEAERAEQSRFREMMATNFDLLEQSVSLSLSKSIGRTPVVEPSELKLPERQLEKAETEQEAAAEAPQAVPPPPSVSTGNRPAFGQGNAAGGVSRGMNTHAQAAPRAGTASPRGSIQPVAMRIEGGNGTEGGETRAFADPDLTPPAAPRILKGHRAAKALYDRGFARFARKDFGQAIMIYEDFLARYPEDVYSDNAQFWIGESYFRQKRLAEAETAYRKVLRNYEHRSTLEGYKTPDAIYRIGQTYLKRNDPRRARHYFAAAAERFPRTSAGRKAQRELTSLMVKTAGSDGPPANGRGS